MRFKKGHKPKAPFQGVSSCGAVEGTTSTWIVYEQRLKGAAPLTRAAGSATSRWASSSAAGPAFRMLIRSSLRLRPVGRQHIGR